MPAKKSAPARFSSNDWAKWVYLIGVIVAGLAGAFASLHQSGSAISQLAPASRRNSVWGFLPGLRRCRELCHSLPLA